MEPLDRANSRRAVRVACALVRVRGRIVDREAAHAGGGQGIAAARRTGTPASPRNELHPGGMVARRRTARWDPHPRESESAPATRTALAIHPCPSSAQVRARLTSTAPASCSAPAPVLRCGRAQREHAAPAPKPHSVDSGKHAGTPEVVKLGRSLRPPPRSVRYSAGGSRSCSVQASESTWPRGGRRWRSSSRTQLRPSSRRHLA